MDLRFRNPSSFYIAGATQSGKTTFVRNLLRFAKHKLRDPRCMQNVIYFYKDDAVMNLMQGDNLVHTWINEKPTTESFVSAVKDYVKVGGSIVIIDDFGESIDKDINDIFKVYCHHCNATVFFMVQNLHENNSRGVSLNATYIVVFKNPRDGMQISHLARQLAISCSNFKWLVAAYLDATREPHSYLLIDNHQETPDHLRVSSCRLPPDEQPAKFYVEKGKGRLKFPKRERVCV